MIHVYTYHKCHRHRYSQHHHPSRPVSHCHNNQQLSHYHHHQVYHPRALRLSYHQSHLYLPPCNTNANHNSTTPISNLSSPRPTTTTPDNEEDEVQLFKLTHEADKVRKC